ncbi:hypothetical protein Bca4012_020678 [Brassica carinata]
MCGAFLWKGTLDGHHTAHVSWDVTKPKGEGGLRIRNLLVWNRACMMTLIWLLFFRSGSIRVAWFIEEVLDGNLSNYWIYDKRRDFSWLANKLFSIKASIFPMLKLQVGNGRTCLFWYHNWSLLGNLQDYLQGLSSRTGVAKIAMLSDIYRNGRWLIRPARSDQQVTLHAHLSTITFSLEEDKYEWSLEGKILTKFSTGRVYNYLLDHSETLGWSKVVWNSLGIPRHSFLSWLVTLNRCPTWDRLLNWGLTTDANCLLCNNPQESRDHLYFLCSFSSTILTAVAARCGIASNCDWNMCFSDLQSLSVPRSNRRIIFMAWECVIYNL